MSKVASIYCKVAKIAELVYMVSENMCPTYLNNLFTNNLCNRTLRSAHNKQLPTFNTVKYGKRSIKYNGPQLWNSLPDEMKTSSTLSYVNVNKGMILRQVFNAGKVFTSPQGDM